MSEDRQIFENQTSMSINHHTPVVTTCLSPLDEKRVMVGVKRIAAFLRNRRRLSERVRTWKALRRGAERVSSQAMSHLVTVRPTFRALVCAVVPEAASLDEGAWGDVEGLVETALEMRPANLQRRVLLFLRFIEWLSLMRYGRKFSTLDDARRATFLSFLQDHPVQLIRLGFWGVRTLALMGYYGRPEAAKAIGYGADPRGWEALG